MSETNTERGTCIRWVLTLLWTILFLYLLVAFSPSESELVAMAGSWSQRIGLRPGSLFKAGHVLGYVLWVILWCGTLSGGYRRPLPRGFWPWLPVLLFLLAAIPEGLQALNPDRHPSWMDVGFNAIGSLIGLGLRQLLANKEVAAQIAA